MRIYLLILILCSSLIGSSQVFVRIYDGVDSFRNSFYNNWHPKGNGKDTSQLFFDLFGNKSIRAVFNTPVQVFDNGPTYEKGQTLLPDTALRKGAYESGFSSFSFIGLNDSLKYNIRLYASRQRTDSQRTSFSTQKDTVIILSDTNSTRVATFQNLVSTKGVISFSWYNFGKATYAYLNAFIIEPVSKFHPVANLAVDSTVITSPNSIVHLSALGSSEKGGVIKTYQFLQFSGPTKAIFSTDSIGKIVVSGLFPGSYRFQLVVNDSLTNVDSAFVNVTVKPVFIPICPTCPVCPICPPPRNLLEATIKLVNNVWTVVPAYSDGNP